LRWGRLPRAASAPLDEAARTLVATKFEMLREASFGFTQDRLLHLQDIEEWTAECTSELRARIEASAPSHVEVTVIEFRTLRCVSVQCRSSFGPLTPSR